MKRIPICMRLISGAASHATQGALVYRDSFSGTASQT